LQRIYSRAFSDSEMLFGCFRLSCGAEGEFSSI
jgi:hypothetical protein